jgi:hypothetical protein
LTRRQGGQNLYHNRIGGLPANADSHKVTRPSPDFYSPQAIIVALLGTFDDCVG